MESTNNTTAPVELTACPQAITCGGRSFIPPFKKISYSAPSVPVLSGAVQDPVPGVDYVVQFYDVTKTGATMYVLGGTSAATFATDGTEVVPPAFDVNVTVYAQV